MYYIVHLRRIKGTLSNFKHFKGILECALTALNVIYRLICLLKLDNQYGVFEVPGKEFKRKCEGYPRKSPSRLY